jgi:hypothetical protein
MNSWILAGARVARGPRKSELLDPILGGNPASVLGWPKAGCLTARRPILPGLINARSPGTACFTHGSRSYPNAGAWARDTIRSTAGSGLRRIPSQLRALWKHQRSSPRRDGLPAITTTPRFSQDFLCVSPDLGWAHSLEFNGSGISDGPPDPGLILHLGEAVDCMGREIFHSMLGALTIALARNRSGARIAEAGEGAPDLVPEFNILSWGKPKKRHGWRHPGSAGPQTHDDHRSSQTQDRPVPAGSSLAFTTW